MARRKKGEHKQIFEQARIAGFVRVRVNGDTYEISEVPSLDKRKWHTIEIVVDRLVTGKSAGATRVADSVEAALKIADGTVLIDVVNGDQHLFSEHFACVHCAISLGELEPRTFSFNNPHGACTTCTGLGYKLEIDPDLVVPDKNMTLREGGVQAWARTGTMSPWYFSQLESLGRAYEFDTDIPFKDLDERQIEAIFYGTNGKAIKVTHRT